MHFEGKALKWHHAYVKSLWNALPGWGEYVKVLLERFGEVCDDPMADLMKLRQKGTIGEYHEEFDAIITRLDFPAENSLSCFLGGLRNDVQMMVKMFQTQTVRKAFTLSKFNAQVGLSLETRHVVSTKPVFPMKAPSTDPKEPEAILDRMTVRRRGKVVTK
ncbi:hypothetical protein Lal_00033739 [Lupinus albus]|nr:hypothetical protein Lal_00033739 [Lupinus albus]